MLLCFDLNNHFSIIVISSDNLRGIEDQAYSFESNGLIPVSDINMSVMEKHLLGLACITRNLFWLPPGHNGHNYLLTKFFNCWES